MKELPKLPYGQGYYSWVNKEHTSIRYKKQVVYDNNNVTTLSVNGKTIAECNKKMREREKEWREECERRVLSSPRNQTLTFAKVSFEWMDTFKKAQLKGKAYDTIESTYNTHIATAPFATYQTESITDAEIQRYLIQLKSDKKSASTIKKIYSFLNQFFAYYYKRQPYNNPMISVSMPTFGNDIDIDENGTTSNEKIFSQDDVLTDEEIEALTNVAREKIRPGVSGYVHGWGMIFIMWSFMRYGEAIGLRWSDINFEEKYALIYRNISRIKNREEDPNYERTGKNYRWSISTTKTGSSTRKEFLCDQAIEALIEYKKIKKPKSDLDYILSTDSGEPIANSNMNTFLRKMLVRAGINKKITVHSLRHTGISYFLRHGVDIEVVSKLAGHSNTDVTRRVYYTIIEDQQKEQIEKVNKDGKEE